MPLFYNTNPSFGDEGPFEMEHPLDKSFTELASQLNDCGITVTVDELKEAFEPVDKM